MVQRITLVSGNMGNQNVFSVKLDVLPRIRMGRNRKKKLKGELVAALQPSTSEQLKVIQLLFNIWYSLSFIMDKCCKIEFAPIFVGAAEYVCAS